MKYLSIDIETTGLDKDKNQIVEIGAVLDELGSDTLIEDLPKFRAVLIHEEMTIGAYCANLHRDLWPEILKIKRSCVGELKKDEIVISEGTYYCTPNRLEFVFHRWLNDILGLGIDYYMATTGAIPEELLEKITINVAGKNPAGFDIPFIENLPNWQGLVRFRRRVFDPASHYARPGDECLPDHQTCLNRAGINKTVAHTAVDDALDVVRLIRHKFTK